MGLNEPGDMSTSFDGRVLNLLAQAWRTERAEPVWLREVVNAAEPLFAPDAGVVGAIAKAGLESPADLSIVPYAQGVPDDIFPVIGKLVEFSRAANDMRRNFASRAPVMTFSDFSCYAQLTALLEPVGVRDVALIFTGPVFGSSLALAAAFTHRYYLTAQQRATLVAASSQLAIAFNAHRFAHGASSQGEELAKVLSPEQASVELRCAELLALGLETKEIAQALDISPEAARKHLSNAMKRRRVHTRVELVEQITGRALRKTG
jgi:DNA-binding CsgD family transcriptional regulator